MGQTERTTIPTRSSILDRSTQQGELRLHQLLLRGFDVAVEGLQPTVECRARQKEGGSGLAEPNAWKSRALRPTEVLLTRSLDITSIQEPVTPNTATSDLNPGAGHSSRTDRLLQLSMPAERTMRAKRIRNRHKAIEEQLAKKVEELARSNGELEQFAYVTSHDLQEPLRMVANYTQLLAERYNGKLDVQADKYIHYAVEGAERMQALIQDLLAFSRAGGGPGNGLKITDSNGVVELVLKNLQVAIENSGAVVNCDTLPVVMARPVQLQQVFQNLIGNAIKFHGTAPPIVQISAQKRGTEWVFSVTDNGIDIAPENTKVIFAVFQRLHSRTEYAGNGIGLAICKKIVEQQGGKIWVGPQTAPGATFKFTWPASLHHAKEKNI